jgi:hypothetical protein
MKTILGFLRHLYQSALRKGKRDWEIIFYCIGTAALFWLLNAMGKVYRYEIEMPVRYRFDDSRFMMIASLPSSVTIRVEGRGWELAQAMLGWRREGVDVFIEKPLDTRYLKPENWLYQARENYPGVKVNAIVSDSLYCRFDKKIRRTLSLVPDLKEVGLRPGFRIDGSVRLTPASLVVEGAESLIRNLPDPLPVRLEMQNLQEPVDQNVKIDIGPDFRGSPLLSFQTEMVNVQFTVRPSLEEALMVPVRLLETGKASALQIREEKAELVFLISDKDRPRVSPGDFQVVADPATFNPSDSTVEVRVARKPAFVSGVELSATRIRVYARKKNN